MGTALSGCDVRGRLLMAAIELFSRKGYAATSVREIVEAAGVTKPVLYYHFHSKEGVFKALMQEAIAAHRAVLDEVRRAGGTASEQILRLCELLFGLMLENVEAVQVMDSVYYGPREGAPDFDFGQLYGEFDAFLRGLVERGVAEGEFPRGNVEDLMLAVHAGFVAGKTSVTDRYLHGDPLRPEDLRRVIGIILDGMRLRPEGRLGEAT
jgi:TetR/AcrR family transcriptional regulator